jgi:hypothetical protein
LTPEEKKTELHRQRDLVLATLNYQLELHAGSIVTDGWDAAREYFDQQKLQTEAYFRGRRLDKLQQQLQRLTDGLRSRVDLQYTSYIKEKTGYDIDLFEGLQGHIDRILVQGNIQTDAEAEFVRVQLLINKQTMAEPQQETALKTLFHDYFKRKQQSEKKATFSEVTKREENDGVEVVTVRISTGPKPVHLEEQEAISPDGKRWLRVTQWSDGKHASTYVVIIFPTTSGTVYAANGIRPDVKAYWKDNHTIVIETKKEYEAGVKYKEVSSFDDVIAIEYIEH